MQFSKGPLAAISFAFGLFWATQPTWAQENPTVFKGKTIKIVVGYSPGGGYDVYAHVIAPYLSKELDATVIVDNQPGAGGLKALNSLYAAPPDGLTLMLVKGNAALMAQLTGEPAARYDLTKFSYLGGTGLTPEIWTVSPSLSIQNVNDAENQKSTIRWAGTGPMDGASDGAAMICEALRLNCRIILGYSGTNDMALALRRGEMDAFLASDASAESYVEEKNVRALATLARARSPYFPNLPTIYETTKLSPAAKWWFDIRSNLAALGRILVAPPGVSVDRMKVLRTAVRKALQNPSLIAQSNKMKHYIAYQPPQELLDAARNVLVDTPEDDKRRIDKVVALK